MFGPHFYYDLIRLVRHRRNLYLRCGYLVALIIAWWVVYEQSQPFAGHINDYARLATNFSQSLILFQYAMILLLAPIYLAGTIVEERESRTLELIFQTQLTDREILLGKFAARVVHLMYFVLLSMPMLAIITLWGGVDMETLVLHFGFSLLLVLVLGSLCLWVSVTSRRYAEAMILAYVLEGAIVFYGSPCIGGALDNHGAVPVFWLAIAAVPIALATTGGFYWIAFLQFRKLRDLNWIKRVNPPPRPFRQQNPKTPRRPTPFGGTAKPVPDQALLWMETEHHRPAFDIADMVPCIGLGVITVIAVLHRIIVWLGLIGIQQRDAQTLEGLCACLMAVLFGSLVIVIATQTTSAVAREREQNTLDFLLLLPVERNEILLVKWLAPWVRNRMLIVSVLAAPLICAVLGVFPLQRALVLVLLPWPALFFISAVGLLLSTTCRRVMTANLIGLGVLVAIFVLHLVFLEPMCEGYANLLQLHDARAIDAELGLICIQQGMFLVFALICLRLAFRLFSIRKTEVRPLAG